ncbi:GNAT superfamily N-acetyltransferase [Rhizobium mesoamericanum]|uniref:GNAT family N-acetyltransferase n=1 Tax=Rhizobium mesoamericanum TaxID=1079800 RepID=UPI0027892F5A|nr:GNAT family N-acetyltransferase [Rhizobium mesoamericanum]MDQ0563641.1 GNAT superfamily N-acetyltransferase [Rhizobium mesoamericanum]
MSNACTIRQARPDELPRLTEIEIDAFATLAEALGVARQAHALPHGVLQGSLDAGLLVVAADVSDRPVGFLAAEEIEGMLYVIELDVCRNWQRRGVGRHLMSAAIEMARTRQLSSLTLTTDRHVPFNAPFYSSLGFVLPSAEVLPRFLRKKLNYEVAVGMDPERRVAMVLTL